MSDRVTRSISDGVADVRLNRPDKRNALDPAMFEALVDTGESIAGDRSIRAVVLSGEGASFCAGLDFASFQAMAEGTFAAEEDGAPRRAFSDAPAPAASLGQHAVHVWTSMPQPVIAAVHGHALGGGFQLAIGADLRYVTPDAQLSVLEVRWGLVPDMTGTQLLPRLVGLDVAKELTFTGRVVSGEEAVQLGLATRVTATPREDAFALAADLAARSPEAVQGAKRLLNMAGDVPLAAGFEEEWRLQRALLGGANNREAVAAYFEKRPARFADPA